MALLGNSVGHALEAAVGYGDYICSRCMWRAVSAPFSKYLLKD